jgi:hypothetical protein
LSGMTLTNADLGYMLWPNDPDDCDHDKVNGEESDDGNWLEEWCERCGEDLPGEPIVTCPVCRARVPESCVDLCCLGDVTRATLVSPGRGPNAAQTAG